MLLFCQWAEYTHRRFEGDEHTGRQVSGAEGKVSYETPAQQTACQDYDLTADCKDDIDEMSGDNQIRFKSRTQL